MRVLIVEDYAPIRESVARGLREAGYAVDTAADGELGLWHAKSNDYDVLHFRQKCVNATLLSR